MSTIAERLQRKRRKDKEDEQLQHEEETDETIKEKKVMKIEPLHSPPKCDYNFYCASCEDLAKKLLGCVLVTKMREGGGSWVVTKGLIVETEAYLGGPDKASHSYNGKRTPRNEAMYMPPGTCYVYSIYGMHHCVNISSLGEGAAILIRSLEPLDGAETMRERRKKCRKDEDLCRGPGKLCQAMGISKEQDKTNLSTSNEIWVETREGRHQLEIIGCPRIGVDYAQEWAEKNLRYYIKGNKYVSKIIK
ncbi:PREDICTED: probable DNA-3-methyladenine glycosylase [Amphimedon queenslandica]|uniref:DNA-3-methyladenine glycosylase n=1 Tax=Amphimedon queenslandica TaxID=400682 RepID=A0A1X7VUD6_AMPQE|nr:PREDICTED: probable DNA-3-methyladenine glycosylase [Amphimedon queenslandica]|eukprot:XP_019853450.1 PREDICTED: probable DNA-3-methyladenine glycosylase [Amphimedon queenslandica]